MAPHFVEQLCVVLEVDHAVCKREGGKAGRREGGKTGRREGGKAGRREVTENLIVTLTHR
ncbi:MAG: hypothetical protein ACJ0BJ_00175 [Pirellulales bacterium]